MRRGAVQGLLSATTATAIHYSCCNPRVHATLWLQVLTQALSTVAGSAGHSEAVQAAENSRLGSCHLRSRSWIFIANITLLCAGFRCTRAAGASRNLTNQLAFAALLHFTLSYDLIIYRRPTRLWRTSETVNLVAMQSCECDRSAHVIALGSTQESDRDYEDSHCDEVSVELP